MKLSAYVLELSVKPGGARRGEFFSTAEFEAIRERLEDEFMSKDEVALSAALYLAVCYGETIALHVVNAGALVATIDLHPHIYVAFRKKVSSFADEEKLAPLRAHLGALDGGPLDAEDIECRIDWKSIEAKLPALKGRRLSEGATLKCEDLSTDGLPFGYYDSETG